MKQAPKHLKKHGKAYWRKTLKEYDIIETHELERLANLCALQDEKFELQQLVQDADKIFIDRWGQPKANPVFKMLHDVFVLELRYVREIGLDLDSAPDDSRPPRQY